MYQVDINTTTKSKMKPEIVYILQKEPCKYGAHEKPEVQIRCRNQVLNVTLPDKRRVQRLDEHHESNRRLNSWNINR